MNGAQLNDPLSQCGLEMHRSVEISSGLLKDKEGEMCVLMARQEEKIVTSSQWTVISY